VEKFVQFLVIGLATGAVYALVAQGLVVVYRGSGVVNFAHGANALVGAGVFYSTSGPLPPLVAFVCAVAASTTIGLLTHVLLMRRLRLASPLVRLVATLGLWVVLNQAAVLHWGTIPLPAKFLLPSGAWEFHGLRFLQDRVIIAAATLALTIALTLLYKRTAFGRATAAVAEKEDIARALGYSVDKIAAANWAIGGALSGVAGVFLLAVQNAFVPQLVALVILPALAAALVGTFSSFGLALAGGLLLGVGGSMITGYTPHVGWSDTLPFLVIVGLLIVRGRALPARGHVGERPPLVGTGVIRWGTIALIVTALLASVNLFDGSSWTQVIITTVTFAFVGLSLIVVVGYAGQLSLAQYALAGVGGYAATRLAATQGVAFEWSALFGVGMAVLAGVVVGLPALRVRGVNLAIVTLGLASAVYVLVFTNAKYNGGPFKGTVVDPPRLFGLAVDAGDHPNRWAALVILTFLILAICVANLRRGVAGRRLIAVRSNETAAASLGISVTGAKLFAFGLGAALAGVGGVFTCFRYTNVVFDGFDAQTSINALLWTVTGGVGYVGSSVFGGAVAPAGFGEFAVGQVFDISKYVLLIGASLLLVTLVVLPDGQVSQWTRDVKRLGLYDHGRIARVRRRWLARLRSTGDEATDDVGGLVLESEIDLSETRVVPKSLEVRSLSVSFGTVNALTDVSLDVNPGEVVGLLGPNGAGKTTLIDAVTGIALSRGAVLLGSEDVSSWPMFRRARAGLSRSFQTVELFDDLTVADNLGIAADEGNRRRYLLDLVWPRKVRLSAMGEAVVRRFDLSADLDRKPTELQHARRREVGIARAIMSNCSVLLLDEPAAGFDETEAEKLASLVRTLADEWGMAVLLIEHNVGFVAKVCDRVVVLANGEVVARGTPDEALRNPAVVSAYLGLTTEVEGKDRERVASAS